MIYYYENEELKFPFVVTIFALLNFGLFCSYYMFVPFAYSALWIYFCIDSKKKNKKIICKSNVILLTVTLLIPFALGYLYHLAPGLYNIFNTSFKGALAYTASHTSNLLNNTFPSYGYIYVNFYSNTILLIPLIVYYLSKKLEEKKLISFDTMVLTFLVIFILILIFGAIIEKVSIYFIMKNYYGLWLMLIFMNFMGLMYLYEKNKKIPFILVGIYVLIIMLNLIFIDAPLGKGPLNENENITNVVEIFGVNKTILLDREVDYNKDELEILKYAKENLDFENSKIEIIGDPEQLFWEYSLLRYINEEDFTKNKSIDGQTKLTLKAMKAYQKIGKVDYMIYLNRSYYFNLSKDKIIGSGELIYENDAGGIIKYNK